MSAVLQEGQKLRRIIKVYGVERDVVATITSEGIEFKTKGSKVGVYTPWATIVTHASTPGNVPSKLHGKPIEFLQDSAKRITASLIKRLEREAKTKGAQ